jgi:hypothetical protein
MLYTLGRVEVPHYHDHTHFVVLCSYGGFECVQVPQYHNPCKVVSTYYNV